MGVVFRSTVVTSGLVVVRVRGSAALGVGSLAD